MEISGIVPTVASIGELLAILFGFLAMMSVVTVAFIIAICLLVRAGVRRVRRDRRVGKAALMMQLHGTAPGPRRDVAHARLRLHESVSSTRNAIALLHANGGPRGQLVSLTRRFEQAAGAFDAQLRLMQTEPHEHILQRMIAPVDARLDQFEGIARQIRHTAFALLGGDLDAAVSDLAAEVDREMRALQAGIDALHALRMGELSAANSLHAGSPAGMPLHAMAKEHSV